MEKKVLKFGFEARYFQQGHLSELTKKLIFVLHGHGQQAKYFLRKFSPWFNDQNCVIAPEGLSKYYLEGFSGRVGATWMTSEDRLSDIENYLSYLNSLYQSLKDQAGPNTKIYILGFSQGAATASRWAASDAMHFDELLLWAGIFPPDMNFAFASSKFIQKKVTYIYGLNDPFLSPEKLDEMNTLSNRLKIIPEVVRFEGAHDIDQKILNDLI